MSPAPKFDFARADQLQKDADLALRDALTTDAEILLDGMLRLLGGSNVAVSTVHHYEKQVHIWKMMKRDITESDAPKARTGVV